MGARSLLFNWYGRSMGTNEGERHLGWSDLMDRCRWFTKISPLLVFSFAECLFTSVYDIFSACIQGFEGSCTEVLFSSLPNWSSEFLWHSDGTFLPSLRDFARLFWNQYWNEIVQRNINSIFLGYIKFFTAWSDHLIPITNLASSSTDKFISKRSSFSVLQGR